MREKLKLIVQSKSFYVVTSIITGILVWLFVLNYSNPMITRTEEIPLNIKNQNAPALKELINNTVTYPNTVKVTIKGRQDTVNNLLLSELYSAVDFANVNKVGKNTLKVSKPVSSRLGIRIEDYYPKKIDFVFDKRIETYLDVNLVYNNNLLKENYKYVSVKAEPDSIPVSDLASIVDELDRIQVNIADSISNGSIDGNKTASFIGRYINKYGEDVSHYFKDTVTVTVKIEVAKEVPIVFDVIGEPKDDFYVESSSLSSKSVLLQGSAEDLRKISSIYIGTADVSESNEDYTKEISLTEYIPEGITIYGNNKTTLKVEIEQYQIKEFEITDDILSKPGLELDTYEYTISPNTFTIKIKGKAKDLENLQRNSLNPTINLTGYSVGVYSIPLKITDVGGFKLIGEYNYSVNITLLDEEPTNP